MFQTSDPILALTRRKPYRDIGGGVESDFATNPSNIRGEAVYIGVEGCVRGRTANIRIKILTLTKAMTCRW